MPATKTKKAKKKNKTNEVKLQTNRYWCLIDLYQDWQVSIVLDLTRQINHYTNAQRFEIYDTVIKTFEDFLIKWWKGKTLDTKK